MSRSRTAAFVAVLIVAALFPQRPAAADPSGPPDLVRLPSPRPSRGTPRPEADPHTVLVRFKKGTADKTRAGALRRHGASADETIDAGATGYTLAALDPGVTPAEAVGDLERDSAVADAQPNYVRHAAATPNDPALKYGDQEYLKRIRLLAAWDKTKGSTGKVIAILDTGIDLDHPDLKARLKPGYNAVNPGATPNDGNGHGTMVAGIAGAITNNNRGIAGAAWNTSLMPVKVLKDNGSGTDADIAEGIVWAADHGASVINLSLGGPGSSAVLKDAISYAFSRNVVVVAAAGNEGTTIPSYPAAYGGVIAVTATDDTTSGTFAWFSNHGWWVDVAAPGMNVVSTYAGTGEQYAVADGTSFAAPLVSGIALMVRTRFPTMNVGQVAYRIRSTARDQGPAGIDPSYGGGRVDALAAVGGANPVPYFAPLPPGSPEPNDSFERATVIGTNHASTIAPEYDVDWFSTYAPHGQLQVIVNPPPVQASPARAAEMDPAFEVYDPQGRRLAQIDAQPVGQQERVTVKTAVAGIYRIKVWNYHGSRSPGAYSVNLFPTAFNGPFFDPDVILDAPGTNAHVAAGDVTGDGRNDVLTHGEGSLHVFAQTDDGSLATSPASLPMSATPLTSNNGMLAIGDVTADGRDDVVVAVPTGLDLFEQAPAGGLNPFVHLPTEASVRALSIADVDGAGDAEIIVATSAGINVLARGDSGWTETSLTDDASDEVEVGDVSNDGLADIVSVAGSALKVYRQNEAGSFEIAESYPLDGSYGPGLEILDVSGDGLLDVVATRSGLMLFHQNAGGTLDAGVTHGTADAGLASADLDGDGTVDLAAGSYQYRHVYMGMVGGGLGPAGYLSWGTASAPDAVALADVSGDGLIDLLVATDYAVRVSTQHEVVPGPPLWVSDETPADLARGVAATARPTITFARSLNPDSINGGTVALVNARTLGAVPATLSYEDATRTVTITPSSPLAAGTPYLVGAWHVRDTDGELLNETHLFRFTTA